MALVWALYRYEPLPYLPAAIWVGRAQSSEHPEDEQGRRSAYAPVPEEMRGFPEALVRVTFASSYDRAAAEHYRDRTEEDEKKKEAWLYPYAGLVTLSLGIKILYPEGTHPDETADERGGSVLPIGARYRALVQAFPAAADDLRALVLRLYRGGAQPLALVSAESEEERDRLLAKKKTAIQRRVRTYLQTHHAVRLSADPTQGPWAHAVDQAARSIYAHDDSDFKYAVRELTGR